jgi:rhodanese-related sulfurtransferase
MKTPQELVLNALKTIPEVSATTLLGIQKEQQSIQLLDVREASEVVEGVIPRSIWVSRGLLEFQILSLIEQLNWNPQKEIYICCRSGNRSALAAISLLEMGFKKPISVAGGFNAWKEAGYPVTTDVLHF